MLISQILQIENKFEPEGPMILSEIPSEQHGNI